MTSKAQGHTPGPWRVGQHYSNVIDDSGFNIANCTGTDRTVAERKANAALIASLPDLLAERDRLRAAIVAYLEHHDGPEDNLTMKKWLDNEGIPNMRRALEPKGQAQQD